MDGGCISPSSCRDDKVDVLLEMVVIGPDWADGAATCGRADRVKPLRLSLFDATRATCQVPWALSFTTILTISSSSSASIMYLCDSTTGWCFHMDTDISIAFRS